MPSPFPGIDPYLENQGLWPDFHARFLTYCCDALADRLPDHYVARMEERIVLVEPSEEERKLLRPDLVIEREGPPSDPPPRAIVGTLALEPVTLPAMILEEVREVRVEILHWPDRELVTVLELLSPSNKVEPGFNEYRANRDQIFGQPVHLVELDFLVQGHRLPMARPWPPGDYFISIARSDHRPYCDVYALSIRQPLPAIPIPLKAPDPYIPLDLASMFATAYERGRYARSIDYDAPLKLPLAPEDRAWAEERARGAAR